MRRFYFPLALSFLIASSLSAAPGDFDDSFDNDGIATVKVGDAGFVTALGLQSDGKIVAAGSAFFGSQLDFALARFNADGSLDDTFGIGGKRSIDIGSAGDDDVLLAIAVQPDDKIIVAGSTAVSATDTDVVVMRFTADGSPDDTFGDFGEKVIAIGDKIDLATTLLIQNDGKIIVAGRGVNAVVAKGGFLALRLTAEGDLDDTFADPDGFLIADFLQEGANINDGVILEGGDLLFTGNILTASFDLIPGLLKLDADGEPFPGFGTDGKISVDTGAFFGISQTLEPLDGGDILIGGAFGTSQPDAGIARVLSDGSLDDTFGGGGIAFSPLDDAEIDLIFRLERQVNGKLVAVGAVAASEPSSLTILRSLPDGELDPDFGVDGRVEIVDGFFNPGLVSISSGLVLQADGKILVGGTEAGPTNADFLVARLEGDPEVCGDGFLGSAEACDDGNAVDGDGCDASCAIEEDGGDTGGDTGEATGENGDGEDAGNGGCNLIQE